MVTAPLLTQGIDIDLPKAKGKDMPSEERLNITIKKDSKIYINNTVMSSDDMKAKVGAISKLNPDVFLKADKDVPYGLVVKVIGDIKDSGIEKLGIVTEPDTQLR